MREKRRKREGEIVITRLRDHVTTRESMKGTSANKNDAKAAWRGVGSKRKRYFGKIERAKRGYHGRFLKEKCSQRSEKAKNSKFLNDFCDFSCTVQKKAVTLQGFWGKVATAIEMKSRSRDDETTRLRLKSPKINRKKHRDHETTRLRNHEKTTITTKLHHENRHSFLLLA